MANLLTGHPTWVLAIAAAAAAMATILLTPLVRRLGFRLGAVDIPGGRKIHHHPVASLGGVAVLGGVLIAVASAAVLSPAVRAAFAADAAGWLAILAGLLVLGAVGAMDDIRPISPARKLAFEIAAATAVVALALPVTAIGVGGWVLEPGLGVLVAGACVVWIVAITNAYNMIDGLDGLAAGVGAISAAVLALAAVEVTGASGAAAALAATAGALCGFLLFNSQPARIFLGDSGTLPVGFLLGALSVMALTRDGTWAVVIAAAALGLPVADLTLAVARRALKSLRVVAVHPPREHFTLRFSSVARLFMPDAEHIHHRLLALGLARREAVLILHVIACAFGASALLLLYASPRGFLVGGLALLGAAYLAGRWLYDDVRLLQRGLFLPILDSRLLRRPAVRLAYDALAFPTAFLAAGWLAARGGGPLPGAVELALVGISAVSVFWVAGIYRVSFRQTGVWDAAILARTVVLAVFLSGAATWLVVSWQLDVVIWLLYGYLALSAVLAARLAFPLLDGIYQRGSARGRRVLIYGAGRGGLLLLRELLSNRTVGLVPAGFVDDAPELWDRQIEGYPVHRGGPELDRVLERTGIDEVILSSSKFPEQRVAEIREACRRSDVRLLHSRFSWEEVAAAPPVDVGADDGAVAATLGGVQDEPVPAREKVAAARGSSSMEVTTGTVQGTGKGSSGG